MIVTGGGRGIGAATARLAATRGYAVCVNYRKERAVAEALVRELDGKAIAVAATSPKRQTWCTSSRRWIASSARVTALVNNAGIVDTGTRVEAISAARLQRMFAVNVFGSFLCAREAVKRMSRRHGGKGGVIVNLSSIAARLGGPGEYVDYAASKGAIDTFTVGLAKEVGAEGIRVNAVRPGIIRTEIHQSSGDPGRLERIGAMAPLQAARRGRGSRARHRLARLGGSLLHDRRAGGRFRRPLALAPRPSPARADGERQVAPRRRACGPPARGDRVDGFRAGVSRHGHRHRQAGRGGARARAAPPHRRRRPRPGVLERALARRRRRRGGRHPAPQAPAALRRRARCCTTAPSPTGSTRCLQGIQG